MGCECRAIIMLLFVQLVVLHLLKLLFGAVCVVFDGIIWCLRLVPCVFYGLVVVIVLCVALTSLWWLQSCDGIGLLLVVWDWVLSWGMFVVTISLVLGLTLVVIFRSVRDYRRMTHKRVQRVSHVTVQTEPMEEQTVVKDFNVQVGSSSVQLRERGKEREEEPDTDSDMSDAMSQREEIRYFTRSRSRKQAREEKESKT